MYYFLFKFKFVLNPMVGKPSLPGNAVESTAATTVIANGGLWTLGFKWPSHHEFNPTTTPGSEIEQVMLTELLGKPIQRYPACGIMGNI